MKRASGVLPAVALTCAALVSCAAVHAQDAPDLAALQQTAQNRHAEWETLAKDMHDRMARILPCDPRALAAVTDVSRASEARLAALADYLRAVSAKAFAETAAVKALLDAEEKRAVEAGLERADAGQEQTAVDTQSDALAQSAQKRTSLEAPQKLLQQIAAMIHQRANATEQHAGSADAAVTLLRDLVAKFEARDSGSARRVRGVRSRTGALGRILRGAPDPGADRVLDYPDRSTGVKGKAMKYSRLSLLSTRKTRSGQAPRGAINPGSRSAVRTAPFALLAVVVSCASGLIGQTGREAYRQAYNAWQQAQANLERDAGTGGTTQVAQADRAGAAAANFETTRVAYLRSSAGDAEQRRRLLKTTATSSSPDLTPPAVEQLAATELQTVTRAIAKFADDKDPAIQQLRQALERERVALTALSQTIQARQKTVAATSETAAALEQARLKTAMAFSNESSQLSQVIAQMELEGAAWADYYEKLAQAIQVANAPPPPAPVEVTAVGAARRFPSPGSAASLRGRLDLPDREWHFPRAAAGIGRLGCPGTEWAREGNPGSAI